MKTEYRIAYIAAHKFMGYPTALQDGVKNGIEEQGHTLINIADLLPMGFVETSPNYFYIAAQIARLLNVGAYIVPCGVINAYNADDTICDGSYIARMLPKEKTIVVEERVGGYRCITKDNVVGMRELILHLIEHHHCRRIVFFNGQASSRASREREAVYREEMECHGLSADGMVYYGIFAGDCDDVAETILRDHPDAEAIICANDRIAQTMYRILKSHNLMPGKDVAVTGFDDDPSSKHAKPPLSTVRLTGYDVGYTAAYEAIRLCEGKSQDNEIIPSRFIHRQSCGEEDTQKEIAFQILLQEDHTDIESLTEALLDELMNTASYPQRIRYRDRVRGIAEKINLFQDPDGIHRAAHLIDEKEIGAFFEEDGERYLTYETFQEVVSSFFMELRQYVTPEQQVWLDGEIVHFHHVIISLTYSRNAQKAWDDAQNQWWITKIVSESMTRAEEPEKAVRKMLEALQKLGIHEAGIYIFPKAIPYIGKGTVTVSDQISLIAKIHEGNAELFDTRRTIHLYDLLDEFVSTDNHSELPAHIQNSYTVGALLTGAEIIGLMILGPNDLTSSEIVRVYYQIAFGLKHLQMIDTERQLIKTLNQRNVQLTELSTHDVLTGMLNRRGFMDELSVYLSRSESASRQAILYFMDMDGLKQINDTYGHDEGDFAIKAAARILEETFEDGIAGRFGGDEFLGFRFPSDETESLDFMKDKLKSLINDFNKTSEKPYLLDISIGSRPFTVTGYNEAEIRKYLDEADRMLYEDKHRHKEQKKNTEMTISHQKNHKEERKL